jgi:hypothetical protein
MLAMNQKQVGLLYTSDEKLPAQDTKVVLRSHDYLSPLSGSKNTSSMHLFSPCSTWTNARGEYVFVINSSFSAGSYIIEAADNNGNCALIDSIAVGITIIENNSDLILPEDTLKPGSRIEGKINISQDSVNFIVCIPGLDRYSNVSNDGTFTFENIPEGNLRLFVKNVKTEQPSSATVVVKTVANQTIIVDTFPPIKNDFDLHLSSNGNGKINGKSGSTDTTIASGTPFTVAAVPNADYYFQSWHLSEGAAVIADTLSATTTITLNSGIAEIRAVFGTTPQPQNITIQKYLLMLTTTGRGNVEGPDSLEKGVSGTIKATPDIDWYFVNWKVVEGTAVITDPTSATTTVILTGGTAQIDAVFSTSPGTGN